jgi:hypothetical protein
MERRRIVRNEIMDEQCVLCGGGAAVRVSGTSFCASCGLQQYSGGKNNSGVKQRRSRRAAALGFVSSGFLLKMLLGAVALATVGGVAASTVPHREEARPATTTITTEAVVVADTATVTSGPEVVATATDPKVFPEVDSVIATAAHEYAAEIQLWADCVSEAASAHTGGRFDPLAGCPRPSDFDLPAVAAPGHGEDGPGSSEDDPGASADAPGQNKPPKEEKDKDK